MGAIQLRSASGIARVVAVARLCPQGGKLSERIDMSPVRGLTRYQPVGRRTPPDARRTRHVLEKAVTVRLDAARIESLTALAVVDGSTTAELIREACAAYVKARVADPAIQEEAERAIRRFRGKLRPIIDAPGDVDPRPKPPGRDKASETAVSLRLEHGVVELLTSLAVLDDFTIADEIRAGVDNFLEQRLQASDIQSQIQAYRRRTEETRRRQEQLISSLNIGTTNQES